MSESLPQFVLHQGCSSPAVVGLQPAKLLVAAVVLLNEHGSPPALLELLLFVVAAEFTLDKDGGLRHLLIKCILPTRTKKTCHALPCMNTALVLRVQSALEEHNLKFGKEFSS